MTLRKAPMNLPPEAPPHDDLTDVPGFAVGHAHDLEAVTGCTVVLCPPQTVGGVDQRGGAPGTRETDLLRPMHLVHQVDAVLLTGGSAFGLAAADGVMTWLEGQGRGYRTQEAVVPIVPTAVIYDLGVGRRDRRPDAPMGFAACQNATTGIIPLGSVGAGTGAAVGKLSGMPSKGGVGSASVHLPGGLVIGALFVVNALGEVIGEDGTILAGARDPGNPEVFMPSLDLLRQFHQMQLETPPQNRGSHTVIGVVATNARLNKEETNKVAQMAHDGLARAVRPAHTLFDGDTIFALASGEVSANVNLVGAYAAEVSAVAIRKGVIQAHTFGGVPGKER